jgi:hypothetical protein
VAYTPTRRPKNYPDRRRQPRGPRVARPLRDRLTTAAELLEGVGQEKLSVAQSDEGPSAQDFLDAAADVRAVLEPGAWRSLQQKGTDWATNRVNLAVSMDMELRGRLQEAAEELGVLSLSAVAAEGLQAVAEGRFVPAAPYKGRGEKRNLNVTVPVAVKEQVAAMLPELSRTAGYPVSLASIVTWWLADELGVDLPDSPSASTGRVTLVIPARLKEHFEQAATARGVELGPVLESGIRDLVSGAWAFPVAPRAAKGTRAQEALAKLTIRVDVGLRAALDEAASRLTDELGRGVYPGTIAIALLKDRLGEPAE